MITLYHFVCRYKLFLNDQMIYPKPQHINVVAVYRQMSQQKYPKNQKLIYFRYIIIIIND